ncbi:hypothetical protein H4F46_05700 [Pectobacterium brasiliense]|uniref:hypothetical protein n=1 Tax=Pectobacterium brasiliense TaxID=180957 RepID=UPI001968F848|nr:hypothetical protein [Pectobacterium brasiliense]MBN3114394.1 hypothetical protein [Pectobacterium brasiliense]
MFLEDMNWDKSPVPYNNNVKSDVHDVRHWFHVECSPAKEIVDLDGLRAGLMDEMFRMKKDHPRRYLTHAIYVLVFNGFIKNPLNLTFDDIENARWAIKKEEYGYPELPPNKEVMNIPQSYFSL